MNALNLHISALKSVFNDLGKGKYLIYFLPGLVVGLIFFPIFFTTETISDSLSFVENIPLIGNFLNTLIGGTFGIIQFIFLQAFTFFILTVLSPFNTLLSEKIESDICGKEFNFNLGHIFSDVFRMILIVILSLLLEFAIAGIYWLISSILSLDFIDEIVYFLIGAFFFGFSFYDYSLERDRKGVSASLKFSFSNILSVTITGCFFLIIYKIPWIGVIASPVLATMISTHVYLALRTKTPLNKIQ